MRVPYTEGRAAHGGPESCVNDRKVVGEALTGEVTGQVLSCEIYSFSVPTPLTEEL
jgi:hypothetical protein